MQKVIAIEDRDGGLHLAWADGDRGWRTMTMRPQPGSMLDDMTAVAEDPSVGAAVSRHWVIDDLLKAPGSELIAALTDDGRSHINSAYMRPAAREWLGESQGWGTLYVRQEV